MLRSTESLSEDARGYGGRPSAPITQSTRRPSTVSTLSNENTYSGLISHIYQLNLLSKELQVNLLLAKCRN